jgi:ABC-2 type transport system ATP-binding protein
MLELHSVSKSFPGIAAAATTLLQNQLSRLYVGTALVLRSLIQEFAALAKVVLFSSHELKHVSLRVVILNRGKIVVDDFSEWLRSLMELPMLESILSQLGVEQDIAAISREPADLALA